MLISIIIPTRNRTSYIKLLISDIVGQDISDYEIIVVDQSDTPPKLINCKHIISDGLGPCNSRNIGAKAAKGDILVFLDDDARVNPDFIREITDPIRNNNYEVVAGAICNLKGEYPSSKDHFLKINRSNFIKVITTNPIDSDARVSLAFPAGCAAIKKDVFLKIGGFDEFFDPTGAGEDRDIALNLFKNGYPIWYNPKAKLMHAEAVEGGSRDVGNRLLMMDFHTYVICKKYFSIELSEELKRTILSKYKRNFINALVKMKNVRSKYLLFQQLKQKLEKVDNEY